MNSGIRKQLLTQFFAPSTRDRLAWLSTHLSAALVLLAFIAVVGEVFRMGLPGLSLDFLLSVPRDSGRAGGISSILVSTFFILAVCLAVAIPVGVGTAVLLAEFTVSQSVFGKMVRRSLDILAGVPSIVFGLFGSAFFVKHWV